MTKPPVDNIPVFYRPYIEAVSSNDVNAALVEKLDKIQKMMNRLSIEQLDFAYAEGKWTLRQLIHHIIDAERVMSYRAMRFSRGDRTELPGFEQDDYVLAPGLAARSKKSLIDEFNAVRLSTQLLFKSLTDDELKREGIANGYVMSANALGFLIAGHAIHHYNVIEERYLKSENFPSK